MRRSLVLIASLAFPAVAATAQKPAAAVTATLFQNVRVFDGKSGTVSGPTNVLVRGNTIARISAAPIPTDKSMNTTIVSGNGRVLMPGLIDAHYHMMMARPSLAVVLTGDLGYLNLVAAQEAQATLLRGFTTVRDAGGPVLGLYQAINEGVVPGPRIYPSGAMISQTGGHGDFRQRYDVPKQIGGPLSHVEAIGGGIIADGPDQVLLRSREQLMLGATQIKLMAGGGVSSSYDPLDVSQYTEAEFRVAVEAAENWGTYVMVHAYTPRAIQAAIAAGVKCIEHGQLMDDATARLMAEKGIWLSLQAFLDDRPSAFPEGSPNRVKQLQMYRGTDTAYALAKKYRIRTAWGTDVLFDSGAAARQGAELAKMTRWFTPAEVLVMATSTNAELLAMSGLRNPYPGKLGVVEEGALADLILVNGNPVEKLDLVADPEQNFVVIMKDGTIYKNTTK